MLKITEDTKFGEIMKEYPWIRAEAVKLSDELKILNNPIGRAMVSRATVSEASRRTGFTCEQIIGKINEIIAAHDAGGSSGS